MGFSWFEYNDLNSIDDLSFSSRVCWLPWYIATSETKLGDLSRFSVFRWEISGAYSSKLISIAAFTSRLSIVFSADALSTTFPLFEVISIYFSTSSEKELLTLDLREDFLLPSVKLFISSINSGEIKGSYILEKSTSVIIWAYWYWSKIILCFLNIMQLKLTVLPLSS